MNEVPKNPRIIKLSPFIVLCLSLAISLWQWQMLDKSFREKAHIEYDQITAELTYRIMKHLQNNQQVLLGGAGLFNIKGEVTRTDWRNYVSSLKLELNYPGIQGLGYSAWLTPAEKEENIRAMKAEGFPDYTVRPGGVRPIYTSIIYLEPFGWRNKRAFGYDMYSESVRRFAMEKAIDNDITTITGKVLLVQETGNDTQNGMLIYVPVYKQRAVEHNRQTLRGFVYSPIRMNDFIHGALNKLPQDIAIEIYTGKSQRADSLMYSSLQAGKKILPKKYTPVFKTQVKMEAYSSTWYFYYKTLPAFEKRLEKTKIYSALILGISVSLMLWAITFLLLNSRNSALKLARAMRSDAEVKERAEQYLMLAGVMFIGLDNHGIVTLANDKACDVLEAKREEILGKNWFENFIPHKEVKKVYEVYKQLMKGSIGITEYYENAILSIEGNEKIIAWHNSVIRAQDGNIIGTLGAGEDLTIRKRLENDLQQSQKMNAIGTLAGGIAHDFNNLLCIILGYASFGLSMIEKGDKLYDILLKINNGALNAQSLTQQLLTFAKGGEPIKKITDLNTLIMSSAEFSISGSKSKCIYDLAPDLWSVEIDEGQFNQVIGNLIINANQAMPDGGLINIKTLNIEVTAEITLSLTPGKYVKLIIVDNGFGISEKILSRIFEPYYTTKQSGSGLGLATTYSIVKKHGGYIEVESIVGSGTIFTINIPASSNGVLLKEELIENSHCGSGRILIMDDEELILELLCVILKSFGYEVTCASDGKNSIRLFQEAYEAGNPFDLVILDLTVPGGLGGAETILELHKIDPSIKAIVSSGYSNDPIMANYKEYGFLDVIPKPYSKKQLIEMLNRIYL